MKSFKFLLPLLIFLSLMILLWRGLSLHPSEVPSPLINKPAPLFELPTLFDKNKITSNQDFMGHITLLNIWATWCIVCAEEHDVLTQIAKNNNIVLIGLNYKDSQKDAIKWLEKRGNPYKMIGVDQTGSSAIDWGVYGTPETFLIDKKGYIRYKHIGPISPQAWEQTLKPLVEKLQKEPE